MLFIKRIIGINVNFVFHGILASKIASLKKERDSLVQRLQQEGPNDAQRTRALQRENAQVCFAFCTIALSKSDYIN